MRRMNKIKTYKDINNGLYISTHHPPLLGEDVLTTVDVEVIGSPNYKGVKCNGIKVSANGKHNVIARWQARSDTVQGTTLNEEAVDFLEPFAKWAAADAYCESKKKIKVEPKETIKAKQHIEFLKQVQTNHPHRKIIIIEDQAKPHIAKAVSQFVEYQKNKLAIYFLPSYSPELNPDEHVWAYLKGFKLKAHQTKSIKEFKPLVLSKMRSIQRKKGVVSSFFYGVLFD